MLCAVSTILDNNTGRTSADGKAAGFNTALLGCNIELTLVSVWTCVQVVG